MAHESPVSPSSCKEPVLKTQLKSPDLEELQKGILKSPQSSKSPPGKAASPPPLLLQADQFVPQSQSVQKEETVIEPEPV